METLASSLDLQQTHLEGFSTPNLNVFRACARQSPTSLEGNRAFQGNRARLNTGVFACIFFASWQSMDMVLTNEEASESACTEVRRNLRVFGGKNNNNNNNNNNTAKQHYRQ